MTKKSNGNKRAQVQRFHLSPSLRPVVGNHTLQALTGRNCFTENSGTLGADQYVLTDVVVDASSYLAIQNFYEYYRIVEARTYGRLVPGPRDQNSPITRPLVCDVFYYFDYDSRAPVLVSEFWGRQNKARTTLSTSDGEKLICKWNPRRLISAALNSSLQKVVSHNEWSDAQFADDVFHGCLRMLTVNSQTDMISGDPEDYLRVAYRTEIVLEVKGLALNGVSSRRTQPPEDASAGIEVPSTSSGSRAPVEDANTVGVTSARVSRTSQKF